MPRGDQRRTVYKKVVEGWTALYKAVLYRLFECKFTPKFLGPWLLSMYLGRRGEYLGMATPEELEEIRKQRLVRNRSDLGW
jgi:hypothetical protein